MLKTKSNKKQLIIYLITILCSALYIIIGNRVAVIGLKTLEGSNAMPSYKAKVITIISRTDERGQGESGMLTISFDAEILSGELKGRIVSGIQQLDNLYPVQMREVESGDKIMLYESTDPAVSGWLMGDYYRFDVILLLIVLFCVGLLIFGRTKGINTIVSLGFTCLSVFVVFIPSVLAGQNIYLWSVVTCIFITVMTLLIINGANRKSLAAGIGCFSGVAVAGLMTLLMNIFLNLTGLVDEDSLYLYTMNEDAPIDLMAIIFAAIIIGAIGAIMDVSMSISSSLREIKDQLPEADAKALFRSGLTIGRDIMGTMANTLVLAYIGSSLSVTLLLVAYSGSLMDLLNREMIIVELLNALAGSFGILLTLPLTSFVCAILYAGKEKKADPKPPTEPNFVSIDAIDESSPEEYGKI